MFQVVNSGIQVLLFFNLLCILYTHVHDVYAVIVPRIFSGIAYNGTVYQIIKNIVFCINIYKYIKNGQLMFFLVSYRFVVFLWSQLNNTWCIPLAFKVNIIVRPTMSICLHSLFSLTLNTRSTTCIVIFTCYNYVVVLFMHRHDTWTNDIL
jgi:hypothetical protein